MEFNKPVSNPMLMGTIELVRAESSIEHREMFIEELVKAEFLAPVLITPSPVSDDDGRLKIVQGSKVQFPALSTTNGQQYLMAFTDKMELDKWKPELEKYSFALTLDDYVSMLLRKDSEGNPGGAMGFVINPFGCNIVISKDMLAQILAVKLSGRN